MNDDIVVQLGMSFTNYTYDESSQRLFIEGPALESGVWSSSDGSTLFYPVKAIQDVAYSFKDHDLVCEHNNLPIGKILDIELTETGFAIKRAYVTHKPSIQAILSGEKKGFSIKANVFRNPVTNVVEKLWKADHIALVGSPACKTCGIKHAYTDTGIVIMSEAIEGGTEISNEGTPAAEETGIEEVVDAIDVTDENVVIMSSKDTEEFIEETKVTEEPVIEEVVDPIVEPVVEIPADATPPEEVIESVVESVDMPATSIGQAIDLSAPSSNDIDILKVALSSATETMASVSQQLLDVSAKLQEMEVTLSATKIELSSTRSELGTVKVEAESYKATIEELQTKIANTELIERSKIISEIQRLDPDVDSDFVSSMTTVQLSAYKSNIDRIASKGMIGGERKGSKVDETTVELSGPEITSFTKRDVAASIIPFLAKNQKNTNSRFGM